MVVVVAVCRGVREAMVAWIVERYGRFRGTSGCCTLASLAAAEVLRASGVRVEIGWGSFAGLPHTWLVVLPAYAVPGEQLGAYADFVDLTADQFLPDVPEVAVVPFDDPARGMYQLDSFGPSAEAEVACPYASADAYHATEVAALYYRRRAEASALASDARAILLGSGA